MKYYVDNFVDNYAPGFATIILVYKPLSALQIFAVYNIIARRNTALIRTILSIECATNGVVASIYIYIYIYNIV